MVVLPHIAFCRGGMLSNPVQLFPSHNSAGTRIVGVPSEKDLDKMLLDHVPQAFGIVFNDTFFYKLKVYLMYGNPFLEEDLLGDFLI